LRAEFKSSPYRNIELVALRDFIEKKLAEMLKENAGRTGFTESLQRTIDEYSAGGTSTEDELELYDILKKPKMTKAQECVKLALEKVFDAELPDSYDRALFIEKSRALYELILNYSAQGQKWTA
jgi:type I restriction enzyme R subunit